MIYGGIRIGSLFNDKKVVQRASTAGDNFASYADGDEVFLPCSIEGKQLPNEPIISLKAKKRIVKTTPPGLAGTVKEHIQLDDYVIQIKGEMINEEEDDLPQQQMRDIRELCEQLGPLKITNRLLSYYNIDYIVITSFEFPAGPGMRHRQPYVINALSDRSIDLVKLIDHE